MAVKNLTDEAPEHIEPHGHPFNPETFRPHDDMVLIRLDPAPKNYGKLELVYTKRPWMGTVISTGPGHRIGAFDKLHPREGTECKMCMSRGNVATVRVKPGDRVMVVRGVGHVMESTGDYICVSEAILLGREERE